MKQKIKKNAFNLLRLFNTRTNLPQALCLGEQSTHQKFGWSLNKRFFRDRAFLIIRTTIL